MIPLFKNISSFLLIFVFAFFSITSQITSFYETGAPWCMPTLWFITALFFCRVLLIIKRRNVRWCIVLFTLIVAMADGYNVLPFKYIPLAYISSGCFFCFLGRLMKEKKNSVTFSYICNIAFVLLLLTYMICPSRIDMRTNTCIEGSYYIAFIGWICGCVLSLWLATNNINSRLLEYIGKNSMTIFCSHFVILILVRTIYKDCEYSIVVESCALLIVLPFIIGLFNMDKTQWIVGK